MKKWTFATVGSLLVVLIAILALTVPAMAQGGGAGKPYIGPITDGEWQGIAFFGPADNQYTAALKFTVTGGNTINGTIKLTFENLPPELAALMNQHGCAVNFTQIAPGAQPLSGYFSGPSEAVGQFSTSRCFLEGYGDLNFANPVSGVWLARAGAAGSVFVVQPTPAGATTAATPTAVPVAAASTPQTPPAGGPDTSGTDPALIALAIKTYKSKCSECHGLRGEGKEPDVRDLGSTRVQRMSNEELSDAFMIGVEGTEMKPFAALLTPEEHASLMYLIRHVELLRQ